MTQDMRTLRVNARDEDMKSVSRSKAESEYDESDFDTKSKIYQPALVQKKGKVDFDN